MTTGSMLGARPLAHLGEGVPVVLLIPLDELAKFGHWNARRCHNATVLLLDSTHRPGGPPE